ncbi:hypothetical protein GTP91_21030 [Rugamonas sp. FT82W]|uniref:PepSY domain-containing protein n=1 Tax=Duganella vulcania TaxID=2692166 RepID=A0A845G703_9BURK|nr:hypothetical protein [Duganella vulcania]MYM89651.1 hypothetical protein [Duganella vulcania]
MAAINAKAAVKAAKDAFFELYEDDLPTAMALEEVEKTEECGRELWAVTLGFDRDKNVAIKTVNGIGAIFNPAVSEIEHRVYKTLFIDAESGEFVRMDIRQVQ